MKGYRRYIALIVLLFGSLILLEYFRPKPVDWTPSFSQKDKIPYGTYALYELLPGMFPGKEVSMVREPIYNQLQDSTMSGNYVFVNRQFEADSLDIGALLRFVHSGNQAFIAAEQFSHLLTDTLQFDTELLSGQSPDSTGLYFPNQPKHQVYTYPPGSAAYFLQMEKGTSYTVLGRNKAGQANFIQVPFGQGYFYISTVPLAFTNYELLTLNQSAYAATALSFLPVQPVYWDEYQKQGRVEDQSVFRVFMRHEALSWAYYLALFTVALFLLFKSKRTQRLIPVIEPLRNTTLDFVKAISSLYFNHADHRSIAEKKINYFLEHLRLQYHVLTHTLDVELCERIIAKSGADGELVNSIFKLIDTIRQSNSISDQTLLMLNKYLEDFYRQTSTKPLAYA
jgi:hypothetical protein